MLVRIGSAITKEGATVPTAAVLGAAVLVGLHSLVDFSLQTQAIGLTFAVLLNRTFAAVREFCGGAEQNDDVTVAVTRLLKPSY